jgi:hypothetical protein
VREREKKIEKINTIFLVLVLQKKLRMSMYRDYIECVVGVNQPITKKAQFMSSYLTALSGKRDLRAQDKRPENYKSGQRGAVGDLIRDSNYKYSPISKDIYGISSRKLTAKQQRERD